MTGDQQAADYKKVPLQRLISNDSSGIESLQSSYQLLTNVVQQIPLAIAVLEGQDYRIKLANHSLYEIWQLPEGDKLGEPVFEAFPSIANVGLEELLDQVRKTGVPVRGDEQPFNLTRNGASTIGYISFIYSSLANKTDLPDILVVATDVTEQVVARRKTAESEARFQTMAEESGMLIAVGDATSNATYFSRAWVELTGRSMKALLDFGWVDLVHPDDRESYVATYLSAFEKKEPFTGEFRLLSQSGDYHWLLATGRARFGTDGAFLGYISSCVDITPIQQAQEALRVSEAKLRSIIATAPAGIGLFMGRDLIIENPNQTFIDIVGKGWGIVGKPLREAMPELISENQVFLQILDEVYTTGKMFQNYGSLVQIVQQGVLTNNYYNITYSPVFDEAGQVYAILDIAIDVTGQILAQRAAEESEARYRQLSLDLDEQVQERTQELATTNEELAANNEELMAISEEVISTNRQLEEANSYLLRSNQNLEQFAYIASHDLQEPLRKIQQFGDLLKLRHAASSGQELDYINRMQVAASRMSVLIKDLLAFSRISTRQAETVPVALSSVLDEIQDNLSVVIEESKANIQRGSLPVVQGDKGQLGQLFQNLFSNAIKFSRRDQSGKPEYPQITVQSRQIQSNELPASVKPSRQSASYYCIEVTDNGIGFDEKYIDRIFQVFQRLHSKTEFAGTGIGLAICQKVVVNHGGAITATSKPGEGATFSLYLPAS